jgi:hypothetical protein
MTIDEGLKRVTVLNLPSDDPHKANVSVEGKKGWRRWYGEPDQCCGSN